VGSLGRFGLVRLGRAGLAPVGPVLFEATPRTPSATLLPVAVLLGGWGFVRGVSVDRYLFHHVGKASLAVHEPATEHNVLIAVQHSNRV
jgi:hypothetical protein